jgi:hypothetical protein
MMMIVSSYPASWLLTAIFFVVFYHLFKKKRTIGTQGSFVGNGKKTNARRILGKMEVLYRVSVRFSS